MHAYPVRGQYHQNRRAILHREIQARPVRHHARRRGPDNHHRRGFHFLPRMEHSRIETESKVTSAFISLKKSFLLLFLTVSDIMFSSV